MSDRFGLWLGFHNADQDTFFAMIEAYAEHYKLGVPAETAQAGGRMVDDARLALGPRGLAVHAGSGGRAGKRLE